MKRILFLLWTSYLICGSSSAQQTEKQVNGWKVSQQNFDRRYIKHLIDEIGRKTYKKINGIVVIKNGELLIEEYFNGAGRDSTHNPRSVGKTFASALVGIALDKGHLKDDSQTLNDFYDLKSFKNYDEKKSNVTIKNLLTMSSGFDGFDFDPQSIGNEENMYPEPNWVNWTLNLPMANDRSPGDKWYYFTAGAVLLGDILNKTVPEGLEVFADKNLFKRLGISNYQWQHTPQNVANTAGGIRLTPLDFAKFGQLYLSKGKWNGQQIISEKWVDATLTRHYETSSDNNGYGYLMWNKKFLVGDKHFDTFYCSGNGGNKIFVFRELNAVVVITASAYGQSFAHPQVDDLMIKYIIPTILTAK